MNDKLNPEASKAIWDRLTPLERELLRIVCEAKTIRGMERGSAYIIEVSKDTTQEQVDLIAGAFNKIGITVLLIREGKILKVFPTKLK